MQVAAKFGGVGDYLLIRRGAYPGIDAEERARRKRLREPAGDGRLSCPVMAVCIGERQWRALALE